ncbi:MAG: hypothetical protein J6S85_03775 [Methanobrevibacter sp.]|nr:hypothetical protein [Methanobrevibacter sp.]
MKTTDDFKEVSFEEYEGELFKKRFALTPSGRRYGDVFKTDYPSKKNVSGFSGYPLGRGTCVFLPKGTRFFIAK